MFIKGGQKLDSAGAVMNLVAHTPEELCVMTRTVPPVKYERTGKPSQQALQYGRHGIRDVEKSPALQAMIPSQPRDQDDAKLAGVQKGGAGIPARS
jgi:hypothetical protein